MIDQGKQNLLGVLVDAIDYEAAVARVLDAAAARHSLTVSALAVHGVMEAVADPEMRHRVNALDLVTPDGQPVRWALNALHGAALSDRCYGPTLTWRVCEAAAGAALPVYLYGSTPEVVALLERNLRRRLPGLVVAGSSPSAFARVAPSELDEIAQRIERSGARIVLVGLGCPRQEVFAYEMRHRLALPVLAVGAAFDYHAGLRRQPPGWVQRGGLQWLWRLLEDPRRLWRRYLTTNPSFVAGVLLQATRLWRPDPHTTPTPARELGHA
jgi:N-acetylglucosaminyldiphosphoundecaprenol N-acetyl-beta-D-mannosaminyltransferase